MTTSQDARLIRDGLPQLKDYLLSNEIFWNLGSDPQLTLGNLLLAEKSLQANGQLAAEDARQINDYKKEWRTAWEKKAEKEFNSRLRLWGQYLDELGENPGRHGAHYRSDVRNRVLLELLASEAPGLSGHLSNFDSLLKKLTVSGDFVWDSLLESTFPKGKFWFLYVKLKSSSQD
jgi:hypothetical protein